MHEFAASAAAELANQGMVDRLIAEGSLWSPPVIQAFRSTPRHRFLDQVFVFDPQQNTWREIHVRAAGDAELKTAYADRALITRLGPADRLGVACPLSSSSQPSLMAEMLQDLDVRPGQQVLEIGAGTGYNAALLGDSVAPPARDPGAGVGRVTSVEVDGETLAESLAHLRDFPERPVALVPGDGRMGFAAAGPYDRIMVTAATPDLEPAWMEQLAAGGVLLAPVALASGLAYLIRGTVRDRVIHARLTRPAYFLPLRGEGATSAAAAPLLEETGQPLPAPWADWFARVRLRWDWMAFSHALALFGWLRGLEIVHQLDTRGLGYFGITDPTTRAGCWLGLQEWRSVGGTSGYDLARGLWQAFLDAGGPRPADYQIRISPRRELVPEPGRHFCRQLPQCQWVWELSEGRFRPSIP